MLNQLASFRTDQFDLPALLDGLDGKNRVAGTNSLIDATDDVAAIKAWLVRFADSPRTFSNYRKEAERIWLWATQEMKKPLSSLSHEDVMKYRAFLAKPPSSWVNSRKLPRSHSDWRPLAGPLSKASIRQAEIIVNSLFSWLVEAGYLARNPLSLSKRKKQPTLKHVTRYLTLEQWRSLVESIDSLLQESDRERRTYARYRWVVRLAYITGMRISELCENTMGGFEERKGNDGKRRWFLTIVGKGNKPREVAATGELIDELIRYRTAVGLTRYPVPRESAPLVLSFKTDANGNAQAGLTRTRMHELFKQIFLIAQKSASPVDAEKLSHASAHWLRHSRGSHLAASGVKLNTIRELFGHVSLSTTSIYLHGEADEMHDEIENSSKQR